MPLCRCHGSTIAACCMLQRQHSLQARATGCGCGASLCLGCEPKPGMQPVAADACCCGSKPRYPWHGRRQERMGLGPTVSPAGHRANILAYHTVSNPANYHHSFGEVFDAKYICPRMTAFQTHAATRDPCREKPRETKPFCTRPTRASASVEAKLSGCCGAVRLWAFESPHARCTCPWLHPPPGPGSAGARQAAQAPARQHRRQPVSQIDCFYSQRSPNT